MKPAEKRDTQLRGTLRMKPGVNLGKKRIEAAASKAWAFWNEKAVQLCSWGRLQPSMRRAWCEMMALALRELEPFPEGTLSHVPPRICRVVRGKRVCRGL